MEQGGLRIESLTLDGDGIPVSFILAGVTWRVAPDPLHWFERRPWWETDRRMPAGSGAAIDVEVWRLQAHPEPSRPGAGLETFEIAGTPDGGRVLRSRSPAPDDDVNIEHPA